MSAMEEDAEELGLYKVLHLTKLRGKTNVFSTWTKGTYYYCACMSQCC